MEALDLDSDRTAVEDSLATDEMAIEAAESLNKRDHELPDRTAADASSESAQLI